MTQSSRQHEEAYMLSSRGVCSHQEVYALIKRYAPSYHQEVYALPQCFPWHALGAMHTQYDEESCSFSLQSVIVNSFSANHNNSEGHLNHHNDSIFKFLIKSPFQQVPACKMV